MSCSHSTENPKERGTRDRRPVLHIWSPTFTNIEGGIQEYSRFAVRAVRESFPEYSVQIIEYRVCSTRQTAIHWILRKMQSLRFALYILIRVLQQRPAAILSTHLHFAPLSWMAKFLLRIPSITILYGIEAWSECSPLKSGLLQGLDHYLAISRFTREQFVQATGVAVDKVGMLPCTFDEDRFVPAQRSQELLKQLGVKPDRKIILTVGRLSMTEQYKGYDQIIRLLPRLAVVIPTIHYLIVGSGNDLERVKKLIMDTGVQDRVTLAGFVLREELPAHYQLCHLYAMPSSGEGFGIAFLEALACGRPCLGGNLDGTRDPLMDGRLGLLVDPKNQDELFNAIVSVLEKEEKRDPDECARLAWRVREEFGYERFRRRLEGEIKAIANTCENK